MASIELPLPNDPADYEPKAVAGKLSYRSAATMAAVVAAEVPLILTLVSMGHDRLPNTNLIFLAAAVPAAIIGTIGMSKRHGLHFELWFPALLRELTTPKVTLPAEVRPTVERGVELGRGEDMLGTYEGRGVAAMPLSGGVAGIPLGSGREAPVALASVAPKALVKHAALTSGISGRDASRLERRGVESVACDGSAPSGSRKVPRRLAARSAAAAAGMATLLEGWDVANAADVAAVLRCLGLEVEEGQLGVVAREQPSSEKDSPEGKEMSSGAVPQEESVPEGRDAPGDVTDGMEAPEGDKGPRGGVKA